MFKAIGLVTGKVYAKGESKAEVFRKLQKKHPYEIDIPDGYKKTKTVSKLYPEEMRVVRT